jgi:hypothetical protein
MLNSNSLRNLAHTLLLLVDKAMQDGYERTTLTTAILFGFISQRIVARNIGCSRQTVGRIATKLLLMALPLPNFNDMDRDALFLIFYPNYKKRVSHKRPPPLSTMEEEAQVSPKKFRLKLITTYLIYRAQEPSTALSYSQFCAIWSAHCEKSKLELRFTYEPGEVLFCDFAGMIASYINNSTLKRVKLYMFVAVLGRSKYMFAYLTRDLTAKSWIEGLVKAIHFFGGSPAVIQFDNAALVDKSGLIASLNEQATILSRYYGVVCDTSRVGTPRDNANAEKHVQHIQNRVLSLLRREKFDSHEDANSYLCKGIEALNNEPMQKTKISRTQLFIEHESPKLNTLPEYVYQPFDVRFVQKTSPSYTVNYKQHEYSVPFKLRNTHVTTQVTGQTLKVFYEQKEIAAHVLSSVIGGRTICLEHMPPNHLAEAHKNETEFVAWAEEVGSSTVAIVKKQYENMKSSRSRPGGKRCIALKNIGKQFGNEKLEQACNYALSQYMHTPSDIKLILKSGVFEDVDEPIQVPLVPTHQNIRGKDYYGGYIHE